MIAEPQHPIAFFREKAITSRIAPLVRTLEVLPAIDFDDYARLMTNEVDDEGSNRRLPAKTCSIEPMRSHPIPNDPLGIGHISTQHARADAQLRRHVP